MTNARRLTPRGLQRREELMAYATRRFADNGFHPTSVADIVEGVGVGKGVFYWYFPSKENLLHEILREALLDLRRRQQAVLADAGDPLHRIEAGIRASVAWAADHPEVMRLTTFARTEEGFAPALERGRRIRDSDTVRHVQDAIDVGQIAEGDPAMLAVAIRGIIEELAREYLGNDATARSPDPAAPSDDAGADRVTAVADVAVRMCLQGLLGAGVRPGRAEPA